MEKVDVSIIIVSYNTADLTQASIESIFNTIKKVSFEIIVVDNNSSDESVKKIKKLIHSVSSGQKLKIIQNKENKGFSAANNIGIKE